MNDCTCAGDMRGEHTAHCATRRPDIDYWVPTTKTWVDVQPGDIIVSRTGDLWHITFIDKTGGDVTATRADREHRSTVYPTDQVTVLVPMPGDTLRLLHDQLGATPMT